MSCPVPRRLGFLGLLHMEVFNQRLEQEYNASVIVTAPTVPYKAVLSSAKLIKVTAQLSFQPEKRRKWTESDKWLFGIIEGIAD